jgi:response regulator of citrate/malate metabolism
MTTPPIRVLIVDDDYHVAGIHAAYVERTAGFAVVGEAHTAAEAREMTAGLMPELVLMDVYLPDGNGLEVVRTLLEQAQAPDVIVISAARELSTVRAAMRLGAMHYLVKPFGYQALAERLSAYQRLRRHIDQVRVAPEQSDVDEMFRLLRTPEVKTARPSKGHSAPTLELVREAVRANEVDISAAEISEQVGISRATAQRYLNYLERHGIVTLQLRYGTTGRPEHRYRTSTR